MWQLDINRGTLFKALCYICYIASNLSVFFGARIFRDTRYFSIVEISLFHFQLNIKQEPEDGEEETTWKWKQSPIPDEEEEDIKDTGIYLLGKKNLVGRI